MSIEIATDAYIAGFPLVVSTRTYRRSARRSPPNTLAVQRQLSGPRHRSIVAPNRDTLYALAIVDLRSGPVVFTHPEVSDRYFSYQLMDMWTESFAYIGTRTTGNRAGGWVVAPAGWAGDVPDGVDLIESPTPQLFLLGRYLVDDEADVARVVGIAETATIEPLDPSGAADLPPVGDARGRPQQVPVDSTYFDELAGALLVNPPSTPTQAELFAQWSALDLPRSTLDEAAVAGHRRIVGDAAPQTRGEWRVDASTGRYGDDLLHRARVARIGWGANVPEESLYPLAHSDAAGDPLDGNRRYRITFPQGRLPPVDAFWSLSVYGADMFFVEHPSGRYSIGDRTPDLAFSRDGSLVIELSHGEPHDGGAGDAVNWLPVPAGPFVLMLRLYLPRQEVIDGLYDWPEIVPVSPMP